LLYLVHFCLFMIQNSKIKLHGMEVHILSNITTNNFKKSHIIDFRLKTTGKPLYKAKFGSTKYYPCREVSLAERLSFLALTKLQ